MMVMATIVLVVKTLNYAFMLLAMTYNFWVILVMSASLPLASMFYELRVDRESILKLEEGLFKKR